MSKPSLFFQALQHFAASVSAKMTQFIVGEPEDQLRGPFENFLGAVASSLGWNIVCTGETLLPGRLGRPDYAIHRNKLLTGYVELKAPGVGVTPTRFKGHSRRRDLFSCFGTERRRALFITRRRVSKMQSTSLS
jgi:hypothetical protein